MDMPESPLPNIAAVQARPGHRLEVSWSDGSHDLVWMGDVIGSHAAFGPLRDEAAFSDVAVVDWGGGIEWASGADFAADALMDVARRQTAARAAE